MTVKEFVDVVNFSLLDYAKIYEMTWNEDYREYDSKFTDKRVGSTKDLEPYYDCELDYFEYETQWGEYDDSAIFIKMPKIERKDENMYKIFKVTYNDGGWHSGGLPHFFYIAKNKEEVISNSKQYQDYLNLKQRRGGDIWVWEESDLINTRYCENSTEFDITVSITKKN